jgi:arylsulfatase A-like enzyme
LSTFVRVLCALALVGACGPAAPDRRSVLVVVADSLAAGHVSAYGYARETTPRFDAFAARGALFEQACSQSSWTLPSVASLMTGLEQELHGLVDLPSREATPDPAFPTTLAERFDAAGYRTVAIVQTPVLGGPVPIKRGFDRYTVLDFSHASLRDAVERAYVELAKPRDEPSFVYLHVTPPHMPYQPPEPFRGCFTADDSGSSVDGSIESCRRIHRVGLDERHPDVQRLAALYDENVVFADDALGGLIERVERLAHRRDLVVVWTSDHGEAFLEHGSQGHNSTVFEEMIRVPLAIRALDGSIAPRRIGGVASLLDLAPTLVELAGIGRWTAETRGVSLVPSLRDGSPPPERVLTFSSRHYASKPERLEIGARRGSFKLVGTRGGERAKLFDLEDDPRERSDASAAHFEVVEELSAAIRERKVAWERLDSRAAGPPNEPDPALEALGYADD